MRKEEILLIVMIFALVISNVSALGFGILPQSISIDGAVRGETYDQELTIYNVDNEACNYEFGGTSDIGDWVNFYAPDGKTPIDTIEVSGKSSEKFIARFLVPSEMSNGVYSGSIYVQTAPQAVTGTTEEMGAVAQAVLKTPIKVNIEVTGGVLAEKETLTAEGDLIAISIVGEPQIGQVIEILATFENTGAIDTNAQFVGELYIDGNKADAVASDELFTPAGETSDLTAYVGIETPGEYVILGHVLYEGKKTDTKEFAFSVPETESATDSGTGTESETPAVTGTHAVTETPTPTSEAVLATETPTVTEAPAVTETPTPTSETDLATETPTVTEAPAVTETPTPEADLATETPAGTEAETDTKVPGFGFIGVLIATIVVFVIAKKSGQKGGRGKKGEK